MGVATGVAIASLIVGAASAGSQRHQQVKSLKRQRQAEQTALEQERNAANAAKSQKDEFDPNIELEQSEETSGRTDKRRLTVGAPKVATKKKSVGTGLSIGRK